MTTITKIGLHLLVAVVCPPPSPTADTYFHSTGFQQPYNKQCATTIAIRETTTTNAIISSSSCPSFQSCYRINCLLGNLSSEAQALLCRNLNPFPYQQSHTLTQALSSVIKLSVTLQIEFASQQYHHHHFHQLFNCTGGLHFPFSGPFLLQLLLNFFIR